MINYVISMKELQLNNSVDKTQLQPHYVNFILMQTVALNSVVTMNMP